MAVIGQAFPYTPVTNPGHFIPEWTFGICDLEMQKLVDQVRDTEKPNAVILISHSGMDVDLKMVEVVSGIDAIFGGHTHGGIPAPTVVRNKGDQTLVTNADSNGKYLGFMQLDVRNHKVQGYRYRLLPIFSNLIEPDLEMEKYSRQVRAPFQDKLTEQLAIVDPDGMELYQRSNFNGTFDQIICDALNVVNDTQISFSPGFRWGSTVLPGQAITMDNVMDQTCTTYSETHAREMSGTDIKLILEDMAYNIS